MDKHVQETFWKAFAESPFIMMKLDGASGHSEPMTAQLDRDAEHAIWFFTTRDNRIAPGGKAMGQMVGEDHEVFACLSGTIVEETDKAVWDRHWNKHAAAWFPGGREDPNIMMLRFDIADAEVWTVDPTLAGKFKLMTGRPIEPKDVGEYATGAV
jgi:general stress protein 26